MLGGGGGFAKGIEQFLGDLQLSASDADFNIRFGDAVEIASPGHEQVALFGQVQIFGCLTGCVRTVVEVAGVTMRFLDGAQKLFSAPR